MTFSYIYLRDNEWNCHENLIKLGVTRQLINRESGYKTCEPILGEYIQVYQIPLLLDKFVEKKLNQYFKTKHVIRFNQYNKTGGTEYYGRSIIEELDKAMATLKVKYKRLTCEEICTQERKEYIHDSKKTLVSNVHFHTFLEHPSRRIEKLKENRRSKYAPYPHQKTVLDGIAEFYREHDAGKIIWACGLGKALLSILMVDILKFNRILVGVPSTYLQEQFVSEILKLFPNKFNICLVGGDEKFGRQFSDLSSGDILASRQGIQFIVSTYHSCHLLLPYQVDFKIGDECHHLVGLDSESEKGFRLFHKIQSNKTLFMTATEKTCDKGYSMDDPLVFGPTIDEKSVKWAIENKCITDYQIVCLKSNKEDIDSILSGMKLIPTNHSLFTSTYMCLKSLSIYSTLTHILLYTNTIEDSDLANEYLRQLLTTSEFEHLNGMYHKSLHSGSKENIKDETTTFKTSHCGIICCAYIFGEGVDLPELNGVCVTSNMRSEIRITQYLLRPNRKQKDNECKVAFIIIPYTDDEWISEGRMQSIIWSMRNEDDLVEQKILVSELKPVKQELVMDETKKDIFVLSENTGELNRIKVRLRYSRTLRSDFTEEEDEYNYVKVLNAELNLESKSDYIESELIHINFIKDAETYFKKRGVWTDWLDFLGTDTSQFIDTKDAWVKYCKYLKIGSVEEYKCVAETDKKLPKDPELFYKDFGNIGSELGLKRGRR